MWKPEFLEWLLKNGVQGAIIIMFTMCCAVLYHWLKRAEPVSLLRTLKDQKRHKLELMLKQDYLPAITHKRIRLELRQLAHSSLSGFAEPHMADAAVLFTTLYKLRGNYLSRWRNWLREEDGYVLFSHDIYEKDWRFFTRLNLPVSTAVLGIVTWLFAQEFGLIAIFPFMLLNALAWWFP